MARHKLINNIIAYGLSNGLSALSPLIILPVLTRVLTAPELGTYSMYVMVYSVLIVIVGLNHHGAMSVAYHKVERHSFIELFKAALIIPLMTGGASFIFLFLLTDYILSYTKLDSYYAYLAALAAFFNVYLLLFLSILQTSNHPFRYLITKLVHTFSDICLAMFFVVFLHYGLSGRIYSFNISILLAVVFGLYLVVKSGFYFKFKGFSVDAINLKSILKYGVPLVPHTIAGVMLMHIDRVILANVVSLDSVGLYMAALQFSMIFLIIIEPVNKAYAPWLYSKLSSITQENRIKIVKLTYLYFFMLFFISLALAYVSKYFYEAFVGHNFAKGEVFLPMMFFGFAFQGMYYSVTNYILYCERTGALSAISCFVIFVGTVWSYFLTSEFGAIGAAYAFMLTNLLLFLCVWFFSNKIFPMPWFSSQLVKGI